jgi:RTX calcium-binding nonapeptide repeat (4 copies)
MFSKWPSIVIVSSLLVVARPARADQACPTTPDASNAILHFDRLPTFPAGHQINEVIGHFDFFGTRPIGACIRDLTAGGAPTLYAVLDSNNNLLSGLPKTYNHLCLTNGPDYAEVLVSASRPSDTCGVTMYPLNYNGGTFELYGLGGVDIITGGNGNDFLWGGAATDWLFDNWNTGALDGGALMGESGDDRLSGSTLYDFISGGDGSDGISDEGGPNDHLLGGAGDECCVYSANQSIGAPVSIDCGGGLNDKVFSKTSTTGCELTSSSCGQTLGGCPGWIPLPIP